MRLFSGKKNKKPEWASFFSRDEYTAFISAMEDYFHKTLHINYEINQGVLHTPENDYGLANNGLDNLARTCKQNEVGDYPEIIASHFNCIIEGNKFAKEFEKVSGDFEQVRQYIAVRLYGADFLSSIGKENYISRGFAGELIAVLILDFPHAITNIKPEQIIPWGKTIDELFEIGLDNVRKKYITLGEAIEFSLEGEMVYSYETEHFFAANVLFEIEERDGLVGKGGSLVAAPTRSIVLVYPIKNMNALLMAKDICITVSGIYDDNPGSLTKEVFWYKEGKFTPLPYKLEAKKFKFYPPYEFIELLNTLD